MKKNNNPHQTNTIAKAIKEGRFRLPEGYTMPVHHGHQDAFTTVRETLYRGKAIRVETTYKMTIDEETVRTHTMVLDDGTVHCHAFPNYSFPSAMDLARKIVDFSIVRKPINELADMCSDDHGGHNK